MADFVVDQVCKGSVDATGSVVLTVYAKVKGLIDGQVRGRYAVYRNETQVMIQFADDDADGVNQRAALAPLFAARSRISAMTGNLRTLQTANATRKADEYDNRLAGALLLALQGDPPGAQAVLDQIVTDMSEDAASDIRTLHLLYAAAATLVVIILARTMATDWFGEAFGTAAAGISRKFWAAAGVGAIGALFSIALEIRERRLPIDLQPLDNIADAVLRIFVGAVSATMLIALLQSGIVTLVIAGNAIGAEINGLVIAAFAGGFTQRLVADFLGGFSLAGKPAPAPTPSASAAATEKDVTGTPTGTTGTAGGGTGTGPADPDHENAPEPDEDEEESAGESGPAGTSGQGPAG